jgi:hypothetical protein
MIAPHENPLQDPAHAPRGNPDAMAGKQPTTNVGGVIVGVSAQLK